MKKDYTEKKKAIMSFPKTPKWDEEEENHLHPRPAKLSLLYYMKRSYIILVGDERGEMREERGERGIDIPAQPSLAYSGLID